MIPDVAIRVLAAVAGIAADVIYASLIRWTFSCNKFNTISQVPFAQDSFNLISSFLLLVVHSGGRDTLGGAQDPSGPGMKFSGQMHVKDRSGSVGSTLQMAVEWHGFSW